MSGEEALLEIELESEFIVFGLLSKKLFPALEVVEQDNSPLKSNENGTKKKETDGRVCQRRAGNAGGRGKKPLSPLSHQSLPSLSLSLLLSLFTGWLVSVCLD